MAKLDKAVVLYMDPPVLNPNRRPIGASCGNCIMGIKSRHAEECTVVHIDGTSDTRVSFEHGVCGLYVGGKPMPESDTHKPMPVVPRSVAGYIEEGGVPTHCGNCEYYLPLPAADVRSGHCKIVEGIVNFYGCCNAWESNLKE